LESKGKNRRGNDVQENPVFLFLLRRVSENG
jgi:hypothetical protein